jgi:hypothetical protein
MSRSVCCRHRCASPWPPPTCWPGPPTRSQTPRSCQPPSGEKLCVLAAAIEGDAGARAAIGDLSTAFAARQQDPQERDLILALPQCLAWLDALDGADQADIRTVLRHITRGQLLDITRFGNGPSRARIGQRRSAGRIHLAGGGLRG